MANWVLIVLFGKLRQGKQVRLGFFRLGIFPFGDFSVWEFARLGFVSFGNFSVWDFFRYQIVLRGSLERGWRNYFRWQLSSHGRPDHDQLFAFVGIIPVLVGGQDVFVWCDAPWR